MKILKNTYYIIIILLILSCQDQEIWTEIVVDTSDNNNNFNSDALHGTSNGNIYAFGHFEDETINCGPLGVFDCQPLKVYVSLDNGESWMSILSSDISIENASYESNKISDDLIQNKALRFAKNLFSSVATLDTWKSYYVSETDTHVFLYADKNIYRSDMSSTEAWVKVNLDNSPEVGYNDLVYMSEDKIHICNKRNNKKKTYNFDGVRYSELDNRSYDYVLIDKSSTPFLSKEYKKIHNNYYFNVVEGNITHRDGGDINLIKVFDIEDKFIYGCVKISQQDRFNDNWKLIQSTDEGVSFDIINIFKTDSLNRRSSMMNIIAAYDNLLLLETHLVIPETVKYSPKLGQVNKVIKA